MLGGCEPKPTAPSRRRSTRDRLSLLACAALTSADCIARRAPPPPGRPDPAAPQPDAAEAPLDCRTVRHPRSGERTATFAAEMTTVPGAARMQMRIEVQERLPGENLFHAVVAPGLSAWRASGRSHVYRYVRQVTNLSAPAIYRALVHFRWLSDGGYVIRRAERLTPRCVQPACARPGAAHACHARRLDRCQYLAVDRRLIGLAQVTSKRTIAVTPDHDDERPQRGRWSRRP